MNTYIATGVAIATIALVISFLIDRPNKKAHH